jgi:hypothetical protein
MKKIVFALVGICFWVSVGVGQVNFRYVFGGSQFDAGYAAIQAIDSTYMVAGTTSSFGSGVSDMYFLKIDTLGGNVWQKTYGGNNIEKALSVKQTLDSGFVLAGYTNSFGNGGYDFYVVKTNSTGDTLWTKTYGGSNWEFANSIEQTADKGFIIAGGTYSFGNGDEDIYIIKTDSMGVIEWSNFYGGTGEEEAKSIKQTIDGGYIVAGYTKSFGNGLSDAYYLKLDVNGDTVWTKTIGFAGNDYANSVVVTDNGDYVFAGSVHNTNSNIDLAFIFRTDQNGDTIWTKQFGNPNSTIANTISKTTNGCFVWSGKINLGGETEIYFYKIDQYGYYVFAKTYGTTSGYDEAFFNFQCFDNGYIVGGLTDGFGFGDNDVLVIKTDSLGSSATGVIAINVNEIVNTETQFILYPNPSNHQITVEEGNSDKSKIKKIECINNQGIIINIPFIKNATNSFQLNTNELNAGIYFIKIHTDNKIICKKMIVQH